MRLNNKTALITGGASGIGAGIARKFVAEGARVVLADINGDAAEAMVQTLGRHATALPMDVSSKVSVEQGANEVLGAFNNLDILVNNAGVTHMPADLESISEEDFDRVMAVNAKSVFLMAKYFIPTMKKAGAGAVLNIASTAGVSPRPRLSWYNASKGFMLTATKSMAVELAPYGIRVNAINPVASETPLLKSFMGEDTPEMRAKFISTIPLGRFSTPEDMGSAAAFLCSEEASMITGVTLEVDGGRCI